MLGERREANSPNYTFQFPVMVFAYSKWHTLVLEHMGGNSQELSVPDLNATRENSQELSIPDLSREIECKS